MKMDIPVKIKKETVFQCCSQIEFYYCIECPRFQTFSKTCLKRHIASGHLSENLEQNPYTCEACLFQTFSNLVCLRHDCVTKKWRRCTYCPYKTQDWSDFIAHGLLEHAQRSDDGCYVCTLCSSPYKHRYSLHKHVRVKHAKKFRQDDQLQCQKCPFVTSWRKSLRRHILTRHSQNATIKTVKWHACDNCNLKLRTKRLLERHVNRNHVDAKTFAFSCHHCDYRSNFKQDLERHILTRHLSEDRIEWHQCAQCLVKFKLKKSLQRHIKLHHSDPEFVNWLQCAHCTYRTKERSSFKRHVLRKHTEADQVPWFRCDFCTYKNITKHDLNKHMSLCKYKPLCDNFVNK